MATEQALPNDRNCAGTAGAIQISNGSPYYWNANTSIDAATGGLVGLIPGAFHYIQSDQPIYFRMFADNGAPTAANGLYLAAGQIFPIWVDNTRDTVNCFLACRAVSATAIVKAMRCR